MSRLLTATVIASKNGQAYCRIDSLSVSLRPVFAGCVLYGAYCADRFMVITIVMKIYLIGGISRDRTDLQMDREIDGGP